MTPFEHWVYWRVRIETELHADGTFSVDVIEKNTDPERRLSAHAGPPDTMADVERGLAQRLWSTRDA